MSYQLPNLLRETIKIPLSLENGRGIEGVG
jgi:hypothetical protein